MTSAASNTRSTPVPGQVVIISGPSGAGKSTVVREVLEQCPLPLVHSVSCTTRAPRQGEIDGVNYHFLSRDAFQAKRQAGEFLECKEVFGGGDWYGTLKQTVADGLAAGKWMVLEIDVEGAMTVLETHPEALTIFLHSGSVEELERRLRGRATETNDAIERRLATARRELALKDRYKFEVINHNKDRAVRDVCQILVRSYEEKLCSIP